MGCAAVEANVLPSGHCGMFRCGGDPRGHCGMSHCGGERLTIRSLWNVPLWKRTPYNQVTVGCPAVPYHQTTKGVTVGCPAVEGNEGVTVGCTAVEGNEGVSVGCPAVEGNEGVSVGCPAVEEIEGVTVVGCPAVEGNVLPPDHQRGHRGMSCCALPPDHQRGHCGMSRCEGERLTTRPPKGSPWDVPLWRGTPYHQTTESVSVGDRREIALLFFAATGLCHEIHKWKL